MKRRRKRQSWTAVWGKPDQSGGNREAERRKDEEEGTGAANLPLLTTTYCPAYRYSTQSTARGTEQHPVEKSRDFLPGVCVDEPIIIQSRISFHRLPQSFAIENLPEKGEMPIHFVPHDPQTFPPKSRVAWMLSKRGCSFSTMHRVRIGTCVSCRKSRIMQMANDRFSPRWLTWIAV